jgi:4-hydroxybenzoate polyprenyltransferase
MNETPKGLPQTARFEAFLPDRLLPYARLARLEKPIGWWLLLLPGWWSICLARIAQGGGMPNLWFLLLFLLGAILTRAAGCTLNDIVDRDIDVHVARTRTRPIAAGAVSVKAAIAFMALLLLAALLILLQFNRAAIGLGLLSSLPVLVYPFMKRITYWPQIFLGIAFNWGALLGWCAVFGSLDWPPVLLYLGGIAWTLAYDTIYAHQDREDDLIVGVKSTAIRLGDASPQWVAIFFAVALSLLAIAGKLAGAHVVYFLGLGFATAHAIWQVRRLDIDDPDRCLVLFKSNRDFGLLIFTAAFLDSVLAGAA